MFRAVLAFLIAARILAAQNFHVYIGGYSDAIYTARFDATSGELTAPARGPSTEKPSFLAIHPNGRLVYAANELDEGRVSGFARDPASGALTPVNSVSAKGAGPCHLSIDGKSGSVMVANYNGGSVAVLPIDGRGRLGEATAFIQHAGSHPHAHWIGLAPDSDLAMVADLGLDQVLLYRFDPRRRSLKPSDPPFVKLAPGSGPRHLAFHPSGRFFYVINELASTITVFSLDRLAELQTVKTAPGDFSGENTTAEIVVHPSGKFLYGSNRGHNSIAVFAVDRTKGTLSLVERVSTRGKTPRNFEIDPTGRWLLAANQNSNSIAVFRLLAADGRLSPAGLIENVPTPTCIRFVSR